MSTILGELGDFSVEFVISSGKRISADIVFFPREGILTGKAQGGAIDGSSFNKSNEMQSNRITLV